MVKRYAIDELEHTARNAGDHPGDLARRVEYYKTFSPQMVLVLLEIARRSGISSLEMYEYTIPASPHKPQFDA